MFQIRVNLPSEYDTLMKVLFELLIKFENENFRWCSAVRKINVVLVEI